MLHDIRVALAYVREVTGAERVSLLGASFGGGVCGYYAAKRPAEIDRLVLLNPRIDYKRRTIDSRPCWRDDRRRGRRQGHLRAHRLLTAGCRAVDGRAQAGGDRRVTARLRRSRRSQYLNPQSQAWQALVIQTVAEWITAS